MSIWFNEDYYLNSKLALMSEEEKTEKHISTTDELKAYMEYVGLTPEDHYKTYGRSEGLNPNPYFNEDEYLLAKLEQLHSIDERDSNGQPYTLESLKDAIAAIGLTPVEHYEMYGSHETKADGTLINPSNAFDANAYAAAKLYQLQHSDDPAEAAAWADKTPADVMEAITEAGMSPVTHYLEYGADEANADKVPMVQTVPSEQRVANDPMRDQLGENVPSNYNPPSEGPADAKAAPVDKPADVGDLANHTVSHEAVSPSDPVKVPGDKGYIAPPDNIRDTNEHPVIPPTTSDTGNVSDNWLVVNSENSAIVVAEDGTILGEVAVSTSHDGTITVPPSETSKPADKLPPIDPDDLPPNVDPGNADDNFVTDTPDTPDDPTPPTPKLPATPSFDKIAGDDVIDMGEAQKAVAITGKADAHTTVEIKVTDAAQTPHSVTLRVEANAQGEFTVDLKPEDIAKLDDGTLTLTASATNGAGTVSKEGSHKVTLDVAVDATTTYESQSPDSLGYAKPTALQNAVLGTVDNPNDKGLLNELQKVYNQGKEDLSSITVDYLNANASDIAKLVHFSENKTISSVDYGNKDTVRLNLDVHDVYGGGLALTATDLQNAIQTSRVSSLTSVISKAYFDVPVIKATAQETVHLEMDKVGSVHQGALTADLLNHDLTFSSLVELFSEMKPIAVDVNAPTLDIHLAKSGDADNVNLMEVRGSVTDITFSGTKGIFGLNIDAHPANDASKGTVKNIDASSLTDAESGVYVNTASIGISWDDGNNTIDKSVNATVADHLTFKGSAGDDILVMTQDKYGNAKTLDGGDNSSTGDTLAVVVNNAQPGQDTTITANEHMNGFENVAFISFSMEDYNDDTDVVNTQFAADAAAFHKQGVTHFITSNDLTLSNYEGETVTVVGVLDTEVNLNLKAANTDTSATINLAMTSNFLNQYVGLNEHSRAVLTNADNINELILKGADAEADILLTGDALQDLANATEGKIDVTGYKGDIQLASGWTYSDGTITHGDSTITVVGVNGIEITTDAA